MPIYILTNKSLILCAHGGHVAGMGISKTRPVIEGGHPLLINDSFTIGGCPTCHRVTWANPSETYTVKGVPALTSQSVGLCFGNQGEATGVVTVALCQKTVQEKKGNLNFAKAT